MKLIWYKLFVFQIIFLIQSCQIENADDSENRRSAGQTEKKYQYMVGPLRERVRSEVLAVKGKYEELIFISPGGLPSDALEIAEEIRKRQYKVVISQICLSACAEYILPAARSIEFRYPAPIERVPVSHAPLIGFHWNAMMIEHLMRKKAERDIEHCTFSDSKKLNALQKGTRVNNKFWKEVMTKLGRSNFTVLYRTNECPWKKMKFENDFWFPTSMQLRKHYKLKFKGSVCADNYEECTSVIDSLWAKGHRFIIGDKLYVSQGAG